MGRTFASTRGARGRLNEWEPRRARQGALEHQLQMQIRDVQALEQSHRRLIRLTSWPGKMRNIPTPMLAVVQSEDPSPSWPRNNELQASHGGETVARSRRPTSEPSECPREDRCSQSPIPGAPIEFLGARHYPDVPNNHEEETQC